MQGQILDMLKELRPEFDYEDSSNFVVDGLLDSFDIISLISMLEEKYEIKVDSLDIVPENFISLEAIESLVKKTRGMQ